MFVRVDQLPGLNLAAKDLHLHAPTNRTGEGVADAHAAGQRFEAGGIHLVEIPDAAVDDRANTAQGAMEVAGDLTPESAVERGLVEVLHDHNLRTRHGCEVGAVLA